MSPEVKAPVKSLLAELRKGLQGLYGARLRGLYLYGSYARGEPESESDVDVLVVLNRIERYGGEIDFTGELISKLSLHYEVSISTVFVSEGDWTTGDTNFLANVREDAVPA